MRIFFESVVCGLVLALLPQCTNDPDVIINVGEEIGSVYGHVEPDSLAATVVLLQDGDTVTMTTTEAGDGSFLFVEIPYGYYTVTAQAGEWFGSSTVMVDAPVGYTSSSRLYMRAANGHLQSVHPDIDYTLTASHVLGDSAVWIQASLYNAVFLSDSVITIGSPNSESLLLDLKGGGDSTLRIALDADSLFMWESVSLTLRFTPQSDGVTGATDSLTLEYVVDSTGRDSIRTYRLIAQVGPLRSFVSDFRVKQVADKTKIEDLNPEHNIMVVFAQAMDRASVERALTVTPHFAHTVFWSADTLRIVPANAMTPGAEYTVTIDATAMTADSVSFRCPFTFLVTTDTQPFFTDYWPRDSSANVDLLLPFLFESPYTLEPGLLKSAFSLVPAVDSLVFVKAAEGLVEINHAALLPDTVYTVTVDSSLTTRMGTVLGQDLTISFRTAH